MPPLIHPDDEADLRIFVIIVVGFGVAFLLVWAFYCCLQPFYTAGL